MQTAKESLKGVQMFKCLEMTNKSNLHSGRS